MTVKIAHVNVSRGYRGGERQTELLIRGLATTGISQVLVARRGEPLAQHVADVDVEVRTVSGHPLGVMIATRAVDLVHVHEGRSVYGAYLRSLVSQTPYIVTRRVDNPIKNNPIAHKAYRGAARVVAVAPQVADIVHRYDPLIRPQVIHSASSGLRVDATRTAAIRNAFPAKFLVGHVGALDNRQKGQEFILQVAKELQTSHADIHFVLVGGGDDEAMLKKIAAKLANVSFIGFVDNVGDYLAAFDIFILPSHKEGIGSILLDAMEQRLPVIASKVGGVPEIVHHEETGILIDAARPDQLKAEILRLRAAPELRHRLAERGHEFAENFTADVMCRRYLDLYHNVLGTIGQDGCH